MTKTIVGFMLVDAPHSALNCAGVDAGERTENITKVKTIRKGRYLYPYVSGQALRYWWRKSLEEKYGWALSPITREKKIAFTAANPISYPDDDIFGYMRALKAKEGGTVTRISPLKNSPLISVIAHTPTDDFGVMARHEGDPVPYEHQFYSTVLKGIFSLDLDTVGAFISQDKAGYKNMYPELEEIASKKNVIQQDNLWILPKEIRVKRAAETIAVLPYINGGAMQTSHLTDITPKLLILVILDGGNHIFMNLVKEAGGTFEFSIGALEEIIVEYNSIMLTDIFIGKRKGFIDELDEKLQQLVQKYENENTKVVYGPLNKVVSDFIEEIPKILG
jgi:CRISPR-associated protein Cst2